MGVPIKYTDEEIIEWMKPFKTRSEIRAFDMARYQLIMRRPSLREHLPIKLTKDGNVVGTYKVTLEERRVIRELKRIEKEILREEKVKLKEETKRLKEEYILSKKSSKNSYKLNDIKFLEEKTAKHIYMGIKYEDGSLLCGRCFMVKPSSSTSNKNMCTTCYNRYMYHRMMGSDHNPNNVRDQFCYTKITHHEKVFEIGIKVDEKTEKYLSMVGYAFLFKEPYDESKFHNKKGV